MNTVNELKGFITNLGKYNEGQLVGEWITFPISEDELEKVLEHIGINDQYEEYFFTDYDNYYDIQFEFGEYTSIDTINETIEAIDNLQVYDLMKLKAILEVESIGVLEAIENLDDYIFYQDMTLKDVAEEIIESYLYSNEIPEFFIRYFDYEKYIKDNMNDYEETEYGVICQS